MRQCQEIINAAYARQKQASQGEDADEDNELRPLLEDIVGTFFGIGARINPAWFSETEVVAWDAGISGWTRPSAAEMVHWIEDENGAEVIRVPRDDQGAEPGRPTVYRMGGAYYPTGLALGPAATEDLTFIFAKRPDAIAELTTDIDPLWPEGHESLLALELGIYVALKDRRPQDAEQLVQQRDRQLMRLLAFLEHEDVGERSRTGNSVRFKQKSIVPIASLLMGGSQVAIP